MSNNPLINDKVKNELASMIQKIDGLDRSHLSNILDAALLMAVSGRDLAVLSNALMQQEGMTKRRAGEIATFLSNRVSGIIAREKQIALGITHAIWNYSNAPCMTNPKVPSDVDILQDEAHRKANGTKYEIANGVFMNGAWTWPGHDAGCRCVSRAIIEF